MATIGSRKVTSIVVTHEGKEMVVDFVDGLAKVPKEVKKFLLGRSPELYFDPRLAAESSGNKFNDDYEAIQYYISKLKQEGNPAKLCSILKGEYETLQGELMSGKYNVKTPPNPQSDIKKEEKKKDKKVKKELDENDKKILDDEEEEVNSDEK
jgi:hypothetical protein